MKSLTLSELARAVWKRPVWFLVPVALGVAAAFGALEVLPRIYRASTQIMVEAPKVPEDYVKATVTTSMDERMKTIEQQIKNRTNLERIIVEMDLYPELRQTSSMEDLVDQARSDLQVVPQGKVFRIYFKGTEPVKVAQTANRVAELFIEKNLDLRTGQAQGTSEFLDRELDQTRVKLEEQESQMSLLKQRYMGALPEQRDTILRQVEQLQAKLEINIDAVDKTEQRKLWLQSQIAQQRTATTAPTFVLPSTPRGPTRLEQLEAQLAELRGQYTERHPDIIRLKEQIAAVRAEGQEIEETDAPELPPARPAAPAPVDPLLRSELAALDLEIRSLHAERQRIQNDIAVSQARLESIPVVEQKLLSLQRDYENTQTNYDSLVAKRNDARLAENLEQQRQSEQFSILERAMPPTEPYWPKRSLLLAIGLVGGCVLGLATSLLREHTDHTYADAEALQQAFPGVRVLATIPVLRTAEATPALAGRRSR